MNLTIGVDIGGTHITAAVVDAETGTLLQETYVREHVDPYASAEQIIAAWTNAIKTSAQNFPSGITRLGISMPGPFDYKQGISLITGLHKFEALYELNVKSLLAESLDIAASNIAMANDAICYLAGERFAGAGKGVNHLAGITLGTGLGSAIYHNERYEMGDLYCMPFRGSRAEEYLCSRWFMNEYTRRTGFLCSGVKQLASIAETNDIAAKLFKEFGETLAEVLILKFDDHFPQKIVVGGNIANAWDLFYPSCVRKLDTFGTMLVKSTLGEDAALVGAVSLIDK